MKNPYGLKPCPFCGYMPYAYTMGTLDVKRIKCSKCNAEMTGKNSKKLIESWNKRVYPPKAKFFE